VKYEPLQLRRSIGAADSSLVKWCRVTLEGGLGQQIRTVPLTVYLLNAFGEPLRAWLFADAYPIKWEVGAFDANKNELAIESVTLQYTFSNRIL
jgi:phage tail-like protein